MLKRMGKSPVRKPANQGGPIQLHTPPARDGMSRSSEMGGLVDLLSHEAPEVRQGALKGLINHFAKTTSLSKKDIRQVAKDIAPTPTTQVIGGQAKVRKQNKAKPASPEIQALNERFPANQRGPGSEYQKLIRELRKKAKAKR